MNFFDRFPPPDRPEPEPAEGSVPRWAKPQATLGAVVGPEVVLARTDDAAVGLGGLVAYPNGFSFTITAFLRRDDRRGRGFHLSFHRDFFDDESPGPEFLRVGVQFADGGAATNLAGFPHFAAGAEPAGPLLMTDGGGGSGRRYEMSFWMWPLPPDGPVTFVCEWPARGIAESRTEVDARLIRDAAARAVPLWSDAG